ncbi:MULTISPECIES: MFS transporter [unclassified Arthrobacter]|uniref:MFS transporter n=1 Tax=unclassified Arthrobacter TaxID=235627 RepID=UPI001C854946|nr:MFS transporter [Arthrobacter sp. MAHUQ-56]MBX7445956.1 MFS transporter [Arthrobacter sp. MAHUQ-56]
MLQNIADKRDALIESPADRAIRLTGQKIGGWFIVRYIAALIGIWVALLTPASVTLALRVGQIDPDGKATSLALVVSAGAAAALFANPIFGALSDRSTSRFGQRRPFIVAGVLVGSLAVFALGFASNIALVTVAWGAAQLAFNAAVAATIAILPERVPTALRGRVSGFMGMTTQAGVVGGVFLIQLVGTDGAGMFVWPAVLGVALMLPLILTLKEVPKSRSEVDTISARALIGALWVNPFKHRDFGLAWIGRCFVWTSLYLLTTYKTYFLIDHLGYTTKTVAPILTAAMFILAICIAVSSIPGGWLSDRIGRRKIFVVAASLLFVIAMLVVAFATIVEHFLIGIGIAGIANGLYLGVDYALVAQVLPDSSSEAAKGMGVFNLSATIPQTLAPLLAPVILTVGAAPGSAGNYTSLYLSAAVLALIGAGITQLIRGVR